MVGGGLLLAITRWMVHRQLTSAKTSSLGQRNRAAGRSKASGDRRRQAPPPHPGRTRRALRRTCAPRNDLGCEANPRRCRARGEPPAKCSHLATLRQLLAPQLRQRRIRSVGPRAPTWGRPPATSPLTAASSSAAIAGATRPAPQPQVWQHRKVRACPEPAQVATPEQGREDPQGCSRCRGCRHCSPRAHSRCRLAAHPPAEATEHADWGSPARQSGCRGAPARQKDPARGGVTVGTSPPTPRLEAKCGKVCEVAP